MLEREFRKGYVDRRSGRRRATLPNRFRDLAPRAGQRLSGGSDFGDLGAATDSSSDSARASAGRTDGSEDNARSRTASSAEYGESVCDTVTSGT